MGEMGRGKVVLQLIRCVGDVCFWYSRCEIGLDSWFDIADVFQVMLVARPAVLGEE